MPQVRADVVMAESLESQVDAMQSGKVDLALEDAETAYLAFSRGTAIRADAARTAPCDWRDVLDCRCRWPCRRQQASRGSTS
ncbi:MAG: hypothetical protein QM736_10725 [Vicinamibacterales bacterium]